MAQAAIAPFRIGTKEIYLPRAQVTLYRSSLGPKFARFRVPLNFSKLDLRDYLWHAYRVGTLSVRVYVKQQRVEQGNKHNKRPQIRRWHRPRAHKFMTVELQEAFEWPEEPADYSEWNKVEVEKSEEEGRTYNEKMGPMNDTFVDDERRVRMREQARELLEGKRRWTGGKQALGLMPQR